MYHSIRYYAVLVVVLLALVACGLPSLVDRSTPSPTPTRPSVTTSQDAAQSMEAKLEEVQKTPAGEDVTLTLTEEEITSYVAVNTPSESQLKDVQVRLRDGAIRVTGNATVGPLTDELTISVRPSVENGEIVLDVVDAQFGSMTIPDNVTQSAKEQIRASLNAQEQLESFKSIEVGDGQITIVATRR